MIADITKEVTACIDRMIGMYEVATARAEVAEKERDKAQALTEKVLAWMAENFDCPSEFYAANLTPSFCPACTSEFDCGTTECSLDCWKRFFEMQRGA